MEATGSGKGKLWHKRAFSEIASSHDLVLNAMDEELGAS
jgi:hypothetical protein